MRAFGNGGAIAGARRHAHRWRRGEREPCLAAKARSGLGTDKCATEFGVGNLGCFLLQQRSFAAIHIHHAIHAAFALTRAQRHTCGPRCQQSTSKRNKDASRFFIPWATLFSLKVRINPKSAFSRTSLGAGPAGDIHKPFSNAHT